MLLKELGLIHGVGLSINMLTYQHGFNWRVKNFWINEKDIYEKYKEIRPETNWSYEFFKKVLREGNLRYMGTPVFIRIDG